MLQIKLSAHNVRGSGRPAQQAAKAGQKQKKQLPVE
jgi:hypothetical protein